MSIPELFIIALIFIESGGDTDAIGKAGEVGCLQITEAVVQDVNMIQIKRRHPTRFDLNDRFSRVKSIQMFNIYISHYATQERLGREPTLEDIARIWNGGPNGWKRKATLLYWQKVEQRLRRVLHVTGSSYGGFLISPNTI